MTRNNLISKVFKTKAQSKTTPVNGYNFKVMVYGKFIHNLDFILMGINLYTWLETQQWGLSVLLKDKSGGILIWTWTRSTSVRVQPTLQYIYHGTSSILCLSCVYYALYLLGIHGIVVQRLYVGVIRTNLNHCHLVPTGPWMKLVLYAYAGPQAWESSPHSNIYHVRQLIYSVFVLCILYTVSVGEFMESVIRTNLNHCYLAPTRLAWCPWDFLFDHQILFLGS